MKGGFTKALGTFHRGEKGITGLETAIILIAFVTVAAVLAYSVLSAGIFSSEKGQQAVYSGLEQAKASMEVVGGVKATANTTAQTVTNISFSVTSVLDDDDIDMGKIIMHYTDDAVFASNISYNVDNLAADGSNDILRPAEVALITVTVASITPSVTLEPYDTFTLELIPKTGATITIQRTLPGYLDSVNDLH